MATVDAKFLHHFWVDEVPTGTINGSNTVFTISQTPLENSTSEPSVDVFMDGLKRDAGTDYTISGTTITFTVAPALGQNIVVNYIRRQGG